MRTTLHPGLLVVTTLLLVALATPAIAQFTVLGPTKCTSCKEDNGHEDEDEWWQKLDGPPPLGHINALKQMEVEDSVKYAAAVGLDETFDGVYDLEGSCVACHATVFKGDARAGVSCENCHGPGSDYLESHQEEDSYQDSLARGMKDVIGNLENWARECMTCHVMDDQRLIDAGHPSGDDFRLEGPTESGDLTKYGVVALHWENDYAAEQVAAAAEAVRAELVARRSPPQLTAAPPTEPPAPAAVVPDPAVAPAIEAPAVAEVSAVADPPTPTAANLADPPATPSPAPDTPAAPPAPSAPTPTTNTAAIPEAPDAVPDAPAPLPPPEPAEPATPLEPPPPRILEPPPPRIVERVVTEEVPVYIVEQLPALPQSPAGIVAAVQGRAVALLNGLLRREGRTPVRVTPPEPSTEYRGADAELLRLQREVLTLAIEALGTAPRSDETPEQ